MQIYLVWVCPCRLAAWVHKSKAAGMNRLQQSMNNVKYKENQKGREEETYRFDMQI